MYSDLSVETLSGCQGYGRSFTVILGVYRFALSVQQIKPNEPQLVIHIRLVLMQNINDLLCSLLPGL